MLSIFTSEEVGLGRDELVRTGRISPNSLQLCTICYQVKKVLFKKKCYGNITQNPLFGLKVQRVCPRVYHAFVRCSVFHKQRYRVGEGAHRACTPCYKVKYCITVKNMGVSPQKRWEGWKCKEFTLEFIMHLLVRGLAFRK